MQHWPPRSSSLIERGKCKLLLAVNEMRTDGAMCLESRVAGIGGSIKGSAKTSLVIKSIMKGAVGFV